MDAYSVVAITVFDDQVTTSSGSAQGEHQKQIRLIPLRWLLRIIRWLDTQHF
ncbi:hypothetical protein COLO4_24947 [Corchorus olitorius]|uniref:Uncharacterized protein n=1 Tax=Corchorus olitorius TaxID=93759 RepID=A0A1R3I5T2_9ROSI|nr:hypothetical protein COLO4_24947 [Corchorus olitorius]